MKVTAYVLAGMLSLSTVATDARSTAPPDLAFPDGAIGSVTIECGTEDICATLTLPNKDTIQVYNEGSSFCQPFKLTIVRMHGDTVLLNNQTESASITKWEGSPKILCSHWTDTYITFDQGVAKLGLYLSHDGALYATWYISSSEAKP